MVSKARLDLPEPDSPVITIRASRGSSTETSLRLCSRAPEMTILSETGIDNESTQANRCSPFCGPFKGSSPAGGRTRGAFALSHPMGRQLRTHQRMANLATRQFGVVTRDQL